MVHRCFPAQHRPRGATRAGTLRRRAAPGVHAEPPIGLTRNPQREPLCAIDEVLADVGTRAVKIRPRCPRANCFAERFVLTARTELTDRMLIFGERHQRTVLAHYVRHYNGRRPHRGQQLRPPQPDHPVPNLNHERITRHPVLAGLINEYEPAA
ncbi:integrase core domain-containing protein [Saccharopolyspora shandongensis]|uniref:integrase core domain-containing protein n=1 Tax=Saccharopolyspora shandongensis TaxID=418495 RepID=UPI0033E09AAF